MKNSEFNNTFQTTQDNNTTHDRTQEVQMADGGESFTGDGYATLVLSIIMIVLFGLSSILLITSIVLVAKQDGKWSFLTGFSAVCFAIAVGLLIWVALRCVKHKRSGYEKM